MTKRRRFRRPLAWIGVLLVCCMMSVGFLARPASAAALNSSIVYFPLQFEWLQHGSGSSLNRSEWAGNFTSVGSRSVTVSMPAYYMSQVASSNGITNDLHTSLDFTLYHGDLQVVSVDDALRSFTLSFGVDYDFVYTVEVSFYVLRPAIGGVNSVFSRDEWYFEPIPVSFRLTSVVDESLAIGESICDALTPYIPSQNLSYVPIQGLQLDFTCVSIPSGYTGDSPEISFQASAGSAPMPFNLWFSTLDLYFNETVYVYPDNDSDFKPTALFSWLTDSVGAVLGTPIFGDFSIGGLVSTVICIGLCVLLAKILS